jgi:hypothetical protein
VAFLSGPDGEFMTGSYLIMDGGLRDARGIPDLDPSSPVNQERARHMQASMARRERLQPLIDQR